MTVFLTLRGKSIDEDVRNWYRHHPVFATHIDLMTILPDEIDVIEVGPRPAVQFVKDAIAHWPISTEGRYRR